MGQGLVLGDGQESIMRDMFVAHGVHSIDLSCRLFVGGSRVDSQSIGIGGQGWIR